jgi:hypothetical protein
VTFNYERDSIEQGIEHILDSRRQDGFPNANLGDPDLLKNYLVELSRGVVPRAHSPNPQQ